MEESNYLLVLDTKDIADARAAELIEVHLQKRKEQFKSFMAQGQNVGKQSGGE